MSRVESARDLLKALPQFKNEFDIINLKNDPEVHALLTAIGFDVSKGIVYDVANHRDRANKVAVGYMVSGEYLLDDKYKQFHDPTDRLVIAYSKDPSLGRELDEISGKRFSYRNEEEVEQKSSKSSNHTYYSEEELKEMGYTSGDEEDNYDGPVNDNYDTIANQIELLKTLLVAARGE